MYVYVYVYVCNFRNYRKEIADSLGTRDSEYTVRDCAIVTPAEDPLD